MGKNNAKLVDYSTFIAAGIDPKTGFYKLDTLGITYLVTYLHRNWRDYCITRDS